MRIVMLISLAGVVFLIATVFSLRAGEKEIRYELPHRFAVEDPQFLRCMGQLLGPGVLPGTRVQAYQNG